MTSPSQQQLLNLGECSKNDAQLRLRGGTTSAQDDGKFWRNLWRTAVIAGLSGGAAGLGCDFILWPIETVKTRVQVRLKTVWELVFRITIETVEMRAQLGLETSLGFVTWASTRW